MFFATVFDKLNLSSNDFVANRRNVGVNFIFIRKLVRPSESFEFPNVIIFIGSACNGARRASLA